MTRDEIKYNFLRSFHEASGQMDAALSSYIIRWLAIVLMLLAVMWSINYFMNIETKSNDTYLMDFGARIVKLVIALTLFILLLTTQGKTL